MPGVSDYASISVHISEADANSGAAAAGIAHKLLHKYSPHMAIECDRPAPEEVSDVGALKALAHTRRQAILQQLYRKGPATSTGLARDLGWNTGATSYHLREIARYGFVEELPERAR